MMRETRGMLRGSALGEAGEGFDPFCGPLYWSKPV